MAAADTAKLIASLELQDKLTPGLAKATSSLDKFGARTTAIGTALGIGFERIAEKGIGLIGSAVRGGIDSLEQLESATSAADAAIAQMGLTGQVTSKQIADWSQQIEDSVGAAFDDKAILAASTTLLRFGKVVPSNLREALVVMTDLATKTGDIDSAASLLAKALADPDKAAGKLARTGVVLTKEQQAQIKAMTKAGDVAGAQAFLLDKLAESTKGAAAASQGPAARAAATLRDALEDAERALAEGLLPVIDEARAKLTTFLKDPQTITRIRDFGRAVASGFQKLIDLGSKIPWGTIGEGLKTAADWAGKLFDVFAHLPPEVQTTIVALAGLNKLSGGAVGGLIKGVLGMTAGVVNINAGVVNGGGGLPGAAAGAAGGIGAATIAAGVGITALAAAAVVVAQQVISGNTSKQATAVHQTLTASLPGANSADLATKLAAIDTGIKQITDNPLLVLVQGDALDQLRQMRAETEQQVLALRASGTLSLEARDEMAATKAAVYKVYDAQERNRLAFITGQARTTAAAQATAAAIRDKDMTPVVKVTTNVSTTVSLTALQRGTVTKRRASYDTSIVAS